MKQRKEQWKKFTQELLEEIEIDGPFDIGIVASFGHMIPDEVIDAFDDTLHVIHPSLLPKYRGSSPIQYALLNGDKETGVSIIHTSKKAFDKGSIVSQKKISVEEEDTYDTLKNKLIALTNVQLDEVLADNFHPQVVVQDDDLVEKEQLLAPKISNYFNHHYFSQENDLSEHERRFSQNSARQLFNKFRALYKSRTKNLRLQTGSVGFYVTQCDYITLDQIREELGVLEGSGDSEIELDRRSKKLLWLATVHGMLESGEIWQFKGLKAYKKAIAVRCDDGWFFLKEGNLADGKTSGSMFLKKHFSEENLVNNFQILNEQDKILGISEIALEELRNKENGSQMSQIREEMRGLLINCRFD